MRTLLMAILATVAMAGCQGKAEEAPINAPPGQTSAAPIPETRDPAAAPDGTRSPTDDELHEIGEVTAVEDGGYPIYVVTIVFHAGQPGFDLTANAEALGLGGGGLEGLKGKMVTVYYTSADEPDLRDIRVKGASVLGADAPTSVAGLSMISGLLSGADAVTESDLPDEIKVTPPDGKPVIFETYVTPQMVTVNGRQVTIFYDTRFRNRITYLKAR